MFPKGVLLLAISSSFGSMGPAHFDNQLDSCAPLPTATPFASELIAVPLHGPATLAHISKSLADARTPRTAPPRPDIAPDVTDRQWASISHSQSSEAAPAPSVAAFIIPTTLIMPGPVSTHPPSDRASAPQTATTERT